MFRCTCFVQNCLPTRNKLDDKAVRCVFLGYSTLSIGYHCYDNVSQHLYHSLDVTFFRMFHSLQVTLPYRAPLWLLFLLTQTDFPTLFLCLNPLRNEYLLHRMLGLLSKSTLAALSLRPPVRFFFGIRYFSFSLSSYLHSTLLSLSCSSPPNHFGFSGSTNHSIANICLTRSFCLRSIFY